MNERRHLYSQKIRKAKKAQLISLKRRCQQHDSAADVNMSTIPSSNSLQDLCVAYIQQPNLVNLTALQSALATSDTAVLELSSPESMMQLCNTLAVSQSPQASSLDERLLASRVLTNLAAMNVVSPSSSGDDYYTKQPQGWCDVLIHSQALPALAASLAAFAIQVDPS